MASATSVDPTININNYPLPTFSVSTLPNATVGQNYSQTVSIVGGHAPFTIVTAGVPGGLATIANGNPTDVTGKPVRASAITLAGTPTALGNHFAVSVVVSDSSNPVQLNSIYYYMDVLPFGAPPQEVIADASQLGPVMGKDQLGVNLAYWLSDSFSDSFSPLFSSAGVGLIRWPGGVNADTYHWQTNTANCGGTGAWAPPAQGDFDTFMQTIPAALPADVEITVNYGSNADCTGPADPNEAAAWVNYSNNVRHYGIRYWTIGNEQYFPETDLDNPPYSPTTYANRIATQFYPLMKAQDPTIQVGIDLAFGNFAYTATSCPTSIVSNQCGWDPIVLADAKYDFVEMHYYPSFNNKSDDTQTLTTWANQIAANFSGARALLTLNGHSGAPIFLGEFDRDSGGPQAVEHESISIVDSLFTAIVFGEITKAGIPMASAWVGVDACFPDSLNPLPSTAAYGWQTFGSSGLFAAASAFYNCPSQGVPGQTPFPKGRAYQILSQYVLAGEHVIAVASTDSSIRAYAATNSGGYALLLINTDSTSAHTLPVTINNAAGSSYTATTLTYGKQQYDLSQSGTWAGAVSANLGAVGTTFNISLPAWSITLVQLH